MSITSVERVPQVCDPDVTFFLITAYLFRPAFVNGASALLMTTATAPDTPQQVGDITRRDEHIMPTHAASTRCAP
jgi:hypothetical protein